MLHPSLVHLLKSQNTRKQLWRHSHMLLKEPIQIALSVAKVDREILDLHLTMSLGEKIKCVIKECILLVISLKQVRQGCLKKRYLRPGVFHIPHPHLERDSK